MNGIQRVLMAGVLAAWGAGAALGQDGNGALRAVLEARYAALKTAMAERDPQAISVVLTADFVSEDLGGKTVTAAEMVEQLKGLPKDPGNASETTLVSIQAEGDVATVEQRYRHKTTKAGAAGAPPQELEVETLSTDTWIRADGVWRIRRTVTKQLDLKVDGRLIAHKDRSEKP
jgi:hypothetical protein